jgi:hypothetical protein
MDHKRLMDAIGAIMTASDEAVLTLSPDGIKTCIVDPSNVMMVCVDIPIKINVTEPVKVGMPFRRLKELFKTSGTCGELTLKMNEAEYLKACRGETKDTQKMTIWGDDTAFGIPLMDPGNVRKPPRMPPLEHAFEARMSARDLRRAVKTAALIDHHIAISAALDGLGFSADDGSYTFEKWIKKDLAGHNVYTRAPETPQRGLFSLDYLEDVAGHLASDELTLQFTSDYPVAISNIRDDLKITYLLAPRIESE